MTTVRSIHSGSITRLPTRDARTQPPIASERVGRGKGAAKARPRRGKGVWAGARSLVAWGDQRKIAPKPCGNTIVAQGEPHHHRGGEGGSGGGGGGERILLAILDPRCGAHRMSGGVGRREDFDVSARGGGEAVAVDDIIELGEEQSGCPIRGLERRAREQRARP